MSNADGITRTAGERDVVTVTKTDASVSVRSPAKSDATDTRLRSGGGRGTQRKVQAIAVEGNGPTDIGARERSTRTRKLRSLSAWERRAGDSRRSTRMLEQAGLRCVESAGSDSRRSTRELQPMSQAYALTCTAGKRDAVAVTEADRTAGIGSLGVGNSHAASGSGGYTRCDGAVVQTERDVVAIGKRNAAERTRSRTRRHTQVSGSGSVCRHRNGHTSSIGRPGQRNVVTASQHELIRNSARVARRIAARYANRHGWSANAYGIAVGRDTDRARGTDRRRSRGRDAETSSIERSRQVGERRASTSELCRLGTWERRAGDSRRSTSLLEQ